MLAAVRLATSDKRRYAAGVEFIVDGWLRQE